MKITGFVTPAIIFAVTLTMIGADSQASEPAATVNGIEISRAEVDAQVDVLVGDKNVTDPEVASQLRGEVLEQLITQQLLWQAANAKGYGGDETALDQRLEEVRSSFASEAEFLDQIEAGGFTEATFREDLKRRLAVEQLIAQDIAPLGTVDNAEIEAFYEENLEAMQLPEEVHARHILIRVHGVDEEDEAAARARIDGLLAEARSGTDFAALAREHSEGPTAIQGGDLGFFGRGQTVAPFERAVFALQAGEISDVVRTQLGFHIVKLEERRGGVPLAKEDVTESIAGFLAPQKLQFVLDAFVKDLRAQSDVTVLPDQ